jgi:multiple sugar transport system ATP-binding protein
LRSPLRRLPPAEIKRKVEDVATLLRIDDKLHSTATRLSGGQMQRVAIGRALVRNPAVTLMDEPLSSLDAKLRNDLRLELKRIQQDLGATMLYVTHDQTEAMTLATRVGVLERGRLVQFGTPREIYENPVSSYVASRLGSPRINLIPRSVLAHTPAPPHAVTAGLRAEHFSASGGAASAASGRVSRLESLSDQRLAHVALNDTSHEIITIVPPEASWSPGDVVQLQVRQAMWFDAQGQRIRA